MRWAALNCHLAVLALALFTYFWRLGTADGLVDEVAYAGVGKAYLRGDFTYNREHPPLAKYLFGIAQLLDSSSWSARIPAALAGLVITAVVYGFVRTVCGWRWSLLACTIWLVLPHAFSAAPSSGLGVTKLDRYAMLEPIVTACAMAALLLGWRWSRAQTRLLAVMTGVAVGLATSSKLPGLLVSPAIVGLFVANARRSGKILGQIALGAGSALAVYLLTYVPFGGEAFGAAVKPVTTQLAFADRGHRILLDGRVYDSAPWWAHLYYQWTFDGHVLTTALVLLAVCSVGTSLRLSAYLWVAALVPLLALSRSPVALAHYRFLWFPPLVILAALGLRWLASGSALTRSVAAVASVVLIVAGFGQVRGLAQLQPGPYQRTACAIRALGQDRAPILVIGYDVILASYLPHKTYHELPRIDVRSDLRPPVPRTGVPQIAVEDAVITGRLPHVALEAELRKRGYAVWRTGGLRISISPSLMTGQGRTSIAGCGLMSG